MRRQTRQSTPGEPSGFRRYLKIAGWMLLMAIVVAWIAALAFPLAIKIGLKQSTAARLPTFGLFAGAALGLAMCLASSIKHCLGSLFLILVTASVFWFFAVLIEGIVIGMGVPEEIAEWLSPVAFCFGLLLSAFALSVEAYEKIEAFVRRKPKNQTGQ